MTANRIPWARPTLYGHEEEYVLDALRSTWISGGPYVERLEREMGERLSVRHAIAVSSGTTAIELALRALELPRGTGVVVPAFGFVAAANMVIATGLRPIYADVMPDTWLLDPDEVARVADSGTAAILPIHLYGNVADMKALGEVAEERGLAVVEDAAEAAFSRYDGRAAGTIGKIGTLSFHATKTITTGEGGMVLTDDDQLAAGARTLRDHGMRKDRRYWHDVVGHNFRLTNLQAAVGCAQLIAFERISNARREIYNQYVQRIETIAGLRLQYFPKQVDPIVWTAVVALEDRREIEVVRQRRDLIMQGMDELGIETRPGFYDLSLLPPYGCPPLANARRISASTIALPTFVGLATEDIDRVCAALMQQLQRNG